MSYRPIPLKTVAVAVIVMVVTTTVVSALTTFTRNVGGPVTVELHLPDGIKAYLDEGLTRLPRTSINDQVPFSRGDQSQLGPSAFEKA
mgnify:CR=1 FL=1